MTTKKIIYGLDIGNQLTKIINGDGKYLIFPSGYKESNKKPITDEYMKHDNRYFTFEKTDKLELVKTNNERMWIESIYAIGSMIAKYEKETSGKFEVYLGGGLPIENCKTFREAYKKYYLEGRDTVNVEIDGKPIQFKITDILINPQGAVVYQTHKTELKISEALLIDIGGGTTDVAVIDAEGKLSAQQSFSLEIGMVQATQKAQQALLANGFQHMDSKKVSAIIQNGDIRHKQKETILNIVNEAVTQFVADFIDELGNHTDIYVPIVLMGGGGTSLERFLRDKEYNLDIVKTFDILANAQAFYEMTAKKRIVKKK